MKALTLLVLLMYLFHILCPGQIFGFFYGHDDLYDGEGTSHNWNGIEPRELALLNSDGLVICTDDVNYNSNID